MGGRTPLLCYNHRMPNHSALNWLRRHPKPVAVICSLLVSGYFLALGIAPNDDAYTYVRVADILLNDGLSAAYAHYPWATYSVLFAQLAPFGVNLFVAGLLFNALLYALLAYCFIELVSELTRAWPSEQRDSALLYAILTITLYPQLNEFRSMLIRDVGFWAFSLIGLLQLIKLARPVTQRIEFWKQGIGFCLALACAFAFRAEALVYLIFSPLLLLTLRSDNGGRRIGDAIRLAALIVGSVSAIAIACLLAGFDLFALLSKFLSTYTPFVEAAFTNDEVQRSTLSASLFEDNAEEHLSLLMIVGLFGTLIASLATAIGFPYASTLSIAALRYRLAKVFSVDSNALHLIVGFALINFGILIGFILMTRFVSARYGMLLSLLVILFIPLILARARRPAQLIHTPSLPTWSVGLLFFYCFVDSFYSFGDRKEFLNEAVAWIQQSDSSAPFISNRHALAYASGRVENYEKSPRTFSADELRATKVGTEIAVELNAQLRDSISALEQEGFFERIAAFSGEGEVRILILRRL